MEEKKAKRERRFITKKKMPRGGKVRQKKFTKDRLCAFRDVFFSVYLSILEGIATINFEDDTPALRCQILQDRLLPPLEASTLASSPRTRSKLSL